MHYATEFDGGAVPRAPFPAASAAAPMFLARLSQEIARCADVAADLQDALAPAGQDGPHFDIKKMQGLDLLEQTLRDLHTVTAMLAAGDQGHDVSSLVKGCKLDDVARRLQGLPVSVQTDDTDFF